MTGKSRSVGADIAMRLVTDSSVVKETPRRFLSYRGTGMRPIGTSGETERRQGRAVELMPHGESPTAKPHPRPQPRLPDAQIRELEGLQLRHIKCSCRDVGAGDGSAGWRAHVPRAVLLWQQGPWEGDCTRGCVPDGPGQ